VLDDGVLGLAAIRARRHRHRPDARGPAVPGDADQRAGCRRAGPPGRRERHRRRPQGAVELRDRGPREEPDTALAALDEPSAAIVDVNGLRVSGSSAWSVFTSARWHVSTWPDVPIMLVCEAPDSRRITASVGVTRYLPVHPTRELALQAVAGQALRIRRRARAEIPAGRAGIGLARIMITDWLTGWDAHRLIPVAGTVAEIFVENVLDHTESAPVQIVESHRDTITVAVEDCSHRPAARHESVDRGAEIVSGLAIFSALSRAWGAVVGRGRPARVRVTCTSFHSDDGTVGGALPLMQVVN